MPGGDGLGKKQAVQCSCFEPAAAPDGTAVEGAVAWGDRADQPPPGVAGLDGNALFTGTMHDTPYTKTSILCLTWWQSCMR